MFDTIQHEAGHRGSDSVTKHRPFIPCLRRHRIELRLARLLLDAAYRRLTCWLEYRLRLAGSALKRPSSLLVAVAL